MPDQAKVDSLVTMIKGDSTGSKGSWKGKGGKSNLNGSDGAGEASQSKDKGIKPWMFVPSKDGESKLLMKNGKEDPLCPNWAKSNGCWVQHNPSKHTKDSKPQKKKVDDSGNLNEISKKKGKKTSYKSGDEILGANDSSINNSNSLSTNLIILSIGRLLVTQMMSFINLMSLMMTLINKTNLWQ